MLPTAASLQGRPVPNVTIKTRKGSESLEIHTADLFKDKTVVVFSLPGAFTPTCSATHLPRYVELAATLKANGADEIVCVAVNDPFVMPQWQAEQHAEAITMLPDGNGAFTEAMGLLVDKSAAGMGKRSWRYAMLVKNGSIDKMFIETEAPGDPLLVSSADNMLKYLNPRAVAPEPVVIFAKPGCPFCAKAKALLQARGVEYSEITFGGAITAITLRGVTGHSTWPQVFVGGKLIGDGEALQAYFDGRATA